MKSILKIIINITITIIFIITIIISIVGGIAFNSSSNAFLMLKQGYNQIKIYDNNGNLIPSDICYEYENINDISKNVINAFIAVEDRNFYKHNGFSTKRIIYSLYNNLINDNTLGASTITQQYIKNMYLSNEKTYKRKLNEIALAFQIEKKYTKNQIMEAYLNSILFGGNVYGIKMASKYYFNKNTIDLSISEAAFLAGMIQAPNYYNPYKNIDACNERKNIVLKCMLNENYINLDQYNKEIKIDIKDLLYINNNSNNNYLNSYLDYIYSQLEFNDIPKEVYTYLNLDIQRDLYNIVNNNTIFADDELNCAIVLLDNNTYGILGLIGNRINNKRVINYATDVLLQPGSTIKPILDYAPAIEYLNYTPATIIKDEPYNYKDGTSVKNYDNKYLGNITFRKALSDSRNIPAIKLFNEIGYEKAFSFANKIGIYNDEIYEADAIGGAKNGYTLLSIANAYQAFASLGYYKKASGIKYIKYNDYIKEFNDLPKLQIKPSTAFLINNILHDVFKNTSYDLKDTYLMAKTGQTNFDINTINKYNIIKSATKDSLLIGYTKDLTIGIWVGYNNISSNNYLDKYKKSIPKSVMKIILDKYAMKNNYYEVPNDIVSVYISIHDDKAYLAKDNGYYEYFIKGTEPLEYYEKRETA